MKTSTTHRQKRLISFLLAACSASVFAAEATNVGHAAGKGQPSSVKVEESDRALVPTTSEPAKDADANKSIKMRNKLKQILNDSSHSGKDSLLFALEDISNFHFPALAKKLQRPSDAVSVFLKGSLSPATQKTLADYGASPSVSGSDSAPLQAVLVQEFNRIISGQSIYEAQRFKSISLRPETQVLLAQKAQTPDHIRLNRLLLEDAYPLELTKQSLRAATRDLENNQGPLTIKADAFGKKEPDKEAQKEKK